MKLYQKCILSSLTCALCVSPLSISAISTDVIDEAWGKPTIVYGGGLSSSQIEQTAQLFDIKDRNYVYELSVDAYDLSNYLGYSLDNSSSLISSVMVQKTSSGGVVVDIITPENITNITEEQYANAAITAGITDCKIEVASIMTVTGESALTGVYKAFEANGVQLDTQRTAIAQDELQMTNEIAQENQENSDFESNVLDQTILEIKQELADLKKQNGSLSDEDIQRVVNEIIKKYRLDEILSPENIQAIISFMEKYVNTSAIDSQEVLDQLNSLAKSFSKNFGSLLKQAQDSGFFDKIIQFFKDLFGR
ncbi:DUF1002 domain-containing protein [Floccifex sp.]|uniref:DUF1002 domain-containing protein n=1 Tax=Floccifex sp. TaxID=2815810 RepID=UPI003EFC80D7